MAKKKGSKKPVSKIVDSSKRKRIKAALAEMDSFDRGEKPLFVMMGQLVLPKGQTKASVIRKLGLKSAPASVLVPANQALISPKELLEFKAGRRALLVRNVSARIPTTKQLKESSRKIPKKK